MRGQPVAKMGVAVTRIGSVLMDGAVSAGLPCACLHAFYEVLIPLANDPQESWMESILSAAPGVPQRLDLLGNRQNPEVTEAALRLLVDLFFSRANQLRQLFDCGLADQLPPLLGDGGEEARVDLQLATCLCRNAAFVQAYARLLVDSAPVVERLLTLLATSKGETLNHVVGFFNNVLGLCDRHITRRLVHEFSMLPALVTVLRRGTRSGDQTLTYQCLAIISHVLVVGEAESKDDERRINPYVDRIDSFGAFELIKSLRDSEDAALAEEATRSFSFLPNTCCPAAST